MSRTIRLSCSGQGAPVQCTDTAPSQVQATISAAQNPKITAGLLVPEAIAPKPVRKATPVRIENHIQALFRSRANRRAITKHPATSPRNPITAHTLLLSFASAGKLKIKDPTLAAHHLAWLTLGMPLDRGMFAATESPVSSNDLDRIADEAVGVFLAAYS